ncbi:MFS transporter [Nosocomiicoccus massiliensis]|uniref:MFS transporter n=2 Tax=Nosocomiicoccus TaxID=489909 RepID=A0AAF1BTF7_9STAP|nr:MFS transporter [Nosocomiicoccus massiliensis]WOS96907.1 MFS transporter [Nosocomiicoccus massiliensis]
MGRGKLLTWLVSIGSIGFLLMELNKESFFMLTALFLMTGVACGSMYSLGLGYLTDVIPRTHIAAGNLLISIIFSIGSILGPVFGGSLISLSNGTLYFSFFTVVMVLVLIGNLIFRYQLKNRTNF